MTHTVGDVPALDNPGNRMQGRPSTAWRSMQNREHEAWGVDELMTTMGRKFGNDDASIGALDWPLRQSTQRDDLFHPERDVPLDGIIDVGQCTVLDVDTLVGIEDSSNGSYQLRNGEIERSKQYRQGIVLQKPGPATQHLERPLVH